MFEHHDHRYYTIEYMKGVHGDMVTANVKPQLYQ